MPPKKGKYDDMTHEDFDRILLQLMKDDSMASILQIPGVYESASDYYNNDILSHWEEEQASSD